MNSNYKIGRLDKGIIILLVIIQIVMLVAFFGFSYHRASIFIKPNDGQEIEFEDGKITIIEDTKLDNELMIWNIGGLVSSLSQLITTIIVSITTIYSFIKMIISKRKYKQAKEKSETEGTLDPESLRVKAAVAEKTFGSYLVTFVVCMLLVQFVEICKSFVD